MNRKLFIRFIQVREAEKIIESDYKKEDSKELLKAISNFLIKNKKPNDEFIRFYNESIKERFIISRSIYEYDSIDLLININHYYYKILNDREIISFSELTYQEADRLALVLLRDFDPLGETTRHDKDGLKTTSKGELRQILGSSTAKDILDSKRSYTYCVLGLGNPPEYDAQDRAETTYTSDSEDSPSQPEEDYLEEVYEVDEDYESLIENSDLDESDFLR